MSKVHKRRHNTLLLLLLLSLLVFLTYSLIITSTVNAPAINNPSQNTNPVSKDAESNNPDKEVDTQTLAIQELGKLAVREAASKDGYKRDEFLTSGSWNKWGNGCNTREKILGRDLEEIKYGDNSCTVLSGVLHDPYTGKIIYFTRGASTSSAVQIDHIVSLSNAWQTGAQNLDKTVRNQLANDDLNLLAVDGPTNQQKSDRDASGWLPPNKAFRCEYVARQIAVKIKYTLWVTSNEHNAMFNTLSTCPDQVMPTE